MSTAKKCVFGTPKTTYEFRAFHDGLLSHFEFGSLTEATREAARLLRAFSRLRLNRRVMATLTDYRRNFPDFLRVTRVTREFVKETER